MKPVPFYTELYTELFYEIPVTGYGFYRDIYYLSYSLTYTLNLLLYTAERDWEVIIIKLKII